MDDASKRDPVLILKIGAEGGSLELLGVPHEGDWTYQVAVNEVALADEGGGYREEAGLAWDDALARLERYPWRRLHTVFVHPDWEARIDAARSAGDVIHPTYLPFTEQHLRRHFARADADSGHTQYYVESARRYAAHMSAARGRAARALADMREPRQIEKDERFWTAATLMAYFHAPERRQLFAALLADAFEGRLPLGDWDGCLDGDLHLYFESDLPSPPAYQEALRKRVTAHPIPYVRQAASRASLRPLEGPTQVDAVLVNASNGFAVLFEAKVLSDVSCLVSFDPARNQIARNIDVMLETPRRENLFSKPQNPLEARDPSRTLFVLLTPQLFKERRAARLYGWLMDEYRRDPAALARDLPHRAARDWASVSARLGWTTWERTNEILPGACRWLG